MKQTPAHEVANVVLLNCIPPNARRIVEFGCSHGALAREYKKLNPDCYYAGVDIDSGYIEFAQRFCDRVVVGDLNVIDDATLAQFTGYDCWIFGDVLEHLQDPWTLLRRIRSIVSQDGCIVACIPNSQHWSVVARLLSGDFWYEESGLLDRTHIRWFTRKTMIDMFVKSGYRIDHCVGKFFGPPNQAVLEELVRVAGMFTSIPDDLKTDLTVGQFVFRVSPTG